jgi:spore germination protein
MGTVQAKGGTYANETDGEMKNLCSGTEKLNRPLHGICKDRSAETRQSVMTERSMNSGIERRAPWKAIRRGVGAAACFAGGMAPLATASAQRVEALWYSTASEQSTQSFLAHADRISIVSPQVFELDSIGIIRGHVDPRVVATAREKGVKLVPLVMNPGFDQATIHHIVNVAAVRDRAVESLVSLCRDNRFDGIQFDIENVNVTDKDSLTRFMRQSAAALHRVGCTVSAAVVPRASDTPGPSSYDRWIFENWRGAYDYKALADVLDFISFMTYAQHTGGTTPGPVAGYTWMEDCLKYVLSLGVAPGKISLGIPSYSDWWYPSYDAKSGARARGSDISYAAAESLLAQSHASATWDDHDKVAWAHWPVAGVNQFLWIEDARAFAAKLELVKRYGLRGYSVWVLGTEDPATWTAVAPR